MSTAASRATPRRILILNPFGIGDVLFTTPLIRAVRRAFPESRIDYLCNRRTETILRHNPHLDQVFVYERDEVVRLLRASWWRGAAYIMELVRRVHRARVDLVIDLSLGERYSFILRALGVARLFGFNYRRRGRFLTDAMVIDGYHDRHVVAHYRRLLWFMGIRLVDDALELQVSGEDRRWADAWLRSRGLEQAPLLIGLVPAGGVSWGVGAPFRRWSTEGFAAVGDALVESRGAVVLLFGESADASICQAVARLMKRPTVDASGQTTLGQFIGLLRRVQLVVCNDGGPLHLAVSQGVKTVSVFGPVDPAVYGPYGAASEHRVVYRRDLRCRPCYHQFKLPPCPYERACLTTIGTDEALEACEEVLGRSPSTHPAAHG